MTEQTVQTFDCPDCQAVTMVPIVRGVHHVMLMCSYCQSQMVERGT